MKLQEKSLGTKSDFVDFLKGLFGKMANGKLSVEGEDVTIPNDKDLEYAVKYKDDEDKGSLTVKVSWANKEEVEEAEEDEEVQF